MSVSQWEENRDKHDDSERFKHMISHFLPPHIKNVWLNFELDRCAVTENCYLLDSYRNLSKSRTKNYPNKP
jgi:hypothetical protein